MQMTIIDFRNTVIADYSNKRKNDKCSVAYAIREMDFWNGFAMNWDTTLRSKLMEIFTNLIQDDKNLLKLLKFRQYSHIQIIN